MLFLAGYKQHMRSPFHDSLGILYSFFAPFHYRGIGVRETELYYQSVLVGCLCCFFFNKQEN